MSAIEILNKLYDGQATVEEAIKLLKLPASEEATKILEMIKNHKVTVEDGKELLDAVSTKQAVETTNPGRGRIRTLGVVTLVFGAFLFLLSMVMVPVMWVSSSPATITYHETQQKNFDNDLKQQLEKGLKNNKNIPGPLGTMENFHLENMKPSSPDNFESQFRNFRNVLLPVIIIFTITLWTISILMLIYSIGLLLLTEWGRKMGIVSSVFSTTVLSIFTGTGIYLLIRTNGTAWILWSFLITISILVFIFSLISLIILKSKKITETIQREIEFRKIAINRSKGAMKNRFYRSRSNKLLLGICGGLADYFNIDPMLTRIGTVLLAVITAAFPVLLVYIICGIIIPVEPEKA